MIFKSETPKIWSRLKNIMRSIFLVLTLIPTVLGFGAVPLVLASHKLVRGLRSQISNPLARQNAETATNLLKQLITECSSDEYIIIDMPGLVYSDLIDSKIDNWPFLTKYLKLASTNFGLSFVNEELDLNYVRDYIVTNCEAEILKADVNDDNTINYIDIRTKVITIKFNELSQDPSERSTQIFKNDEFIRKIIRKLPSPHYTIIITSSVLLEIHHIPQHVIDSRPHKYALFNKLINDERRNNEVELHNMYRKIEPHWIAPRHSNDVYLRNKNSDKVKFLDYAVWMKHEKLIMTVILMILTVMLIKLNKLFVNLTHKVKLP